ncbi:gene transfer agent family protein [Ancylobacter polymorphus]|uniref:Gene transfer agent family protein n=1 Tax=Ancylobacter polymorphus TaxID=223390 RepID=A0A9E7A0U8_9HYPH|nr:gene transfer agent family protein [Ancylobacter polymorphus]UOK70438.1 gene transfer agent family protein [Ancylobacter polymorphus]
MLVNSISATISGHEHRLTVRRDSLSILDAVLGGSAYAVLKKFEAGTWSTNDVELVLSFALHGPTPMERIIAKLGAPQPTGERRATAPEIAAAINRNGPGQYADLAALTLSAALFGISESDAVWTDEVADAA